jgi:hypothetical protein
MASEEFTPPKINDPIRRSDLEAVLDYLPWLESLKSGESEEIWTKRGRLVPEDDGTILIVPPEYMPTVNEFLQCLYQHGFVRKFDWQNWQPRAVRFENPGLIQKAQMLTCIKLLTYHARYEHFCDGHLGVMLEEGHIAAILNRMDELLSKGWNKEGN